MSSNIKETSLQEGKITVLKLKGNFVGGDETDDLQNTIKKLSDSGNLKLVIDLGEVSYLNSSALGVLISAHANYTKRNGKVKLCQLNKNLENLFVITKLSLIFDTYPSEMEAVASFSD
ncbi:MAG: STAS domain-containing protein [Ignavibacteria bacterium]|nr:STAS domain-containing protein [Ignavibacteria bacterium]